MITEGPTLQHLLRRVTETPSDFLERPRTADGQGIIQVPAVASDLLELHSHQPTLFPSLQAPEITLLLCWLLADPQLISKKIPFQDLQTLLTKNSAELAEQNTAKTYHHDPERREELVRVVLSRLDMRPSGESIPQATDRLTTLSTAERNRVLAASRAAEKRAQKIREQLTAQRAREAADKYTRE